MTTRDEILTKALEYIASEPNVPGVRDSDIARAALEAATKLETDTVSCDCGMANVPQCEFITTNGNRCLKAKGGHGYHVSSNSGWVGTK